MEKHKNLTKKGNTKGTRYHKNFAKKSNKFHYHFNTGVKIWAITHTHYNKKWEKKLQINYTVPESIYNKQ